jgi:hypothetical protein
MARKLSERERRVLIGGLVVAALIVVVNVGPRLVRHWQEVRVSLSILQAKMKDLPDAKVRASLMAVVPVLDIPKPEEKQKFEFRDKLHEQFEKAGIKTEPLSFLTVKKKVGAYRTLLVKCKAKCKFDQVLDLLAALKDNPYLLGVEEIRIQCDTKQPPEKRQEVEIDMTVSTLVQDAVGKAITKEPS